MVNLIPSFSCHGGSILVKHSWWLRLSVNPYTCPMDKLRDIACSPPVKGIVDADRLGIPLTTFSPTVILLTSRPFKLPALPSFLRALTQLLLVLLDDRLVLLVEGVPQYDVFPHFDTLLVERINDRVVLENDVACLGLVAPLVLPVDSNVSYFNLAELCEELPQILFLYMSWDVVQENSRFSDILDMGL
jgi:hypothetical protein